MKQGDLSQWNNIEACKNLLFFAQLVNELLFDYSIPSNRISTLNSHFLCLDAINVINGIERSGVNEGSLKPIIEELYTTLEKDITFIKHGENPLDYFMKMQPNGSYRRISKTEELNLQDAKNAVYAIQNKYFRSSWYSDMLVEDICALVKSNDPQDQLDLFRQTNLFLLNWLIKVTVPDTLLIKQISFSIEAGCQLFHLTSFRISFLYFRIRKIHMKSF